MPGIITEHNKMIDVNLNLSIEKERDKKEIDNMRTSFKKFFQSVITVSIAIMIIVVSFPVHAEEDTTNLDFSSRYLTIDGENMHVALYGNMQQIGDNISFVDEDKTTLVMIPGFGVPSPHLYFKPLAQALDSNFNVVIVEPFGYGLSSLIDNNRTLQNINSELNEALELLDIDKCVLLTHSMSGVYGLNFAYEYPEKVEGFIAIDNTIYDENIQAEMEMEQQYMLEEMNKFDELRKSFSSLTDFQLALSENPEQYGAALPEITGYTYSDSDWEEYIQGYSLSCNENIKKELMQMDQALLTIKDKKFPDSLPVLTMLSSDNAQNIPIWENAHRNQLNFESGNHELFILNGSHYIWYTNLSGVVDHINDWQTYHQL